MMLSPSDSGGSVTELSVTGRYRGGGDRVAWNLRDSRRWSILLIFEKLMIGDAISDAWANSPRECPGPNRKSRLSQVEPKLLLFRCVWAARPPTSQGRRTVRLQSQPYAQDPRFNAGIAASSVVRSENAARLS